MDKIKTVKIKNPDGSVSEETYTISVDAKNVDMQNGKDLQDTIGDINIDENGNINQQLNNIHIDLSRKIYCFNTIIDMKNFTQFKTGDYAYTLGYYNINDGGSAYYKITNNQQSTEHQENIGNLYATLMHDKIVNIKQFGAYGDGVHDDTIPLQKMFSINVDKYIISSGTYMLNANLNILSNSIIQFEGDAKIIRKATNLTNYYMFNIVNKENITVINGHLIGDKNTHTGSSGEWGYCYNVMFAKNIKLINCVAELAWGDGFYIGNHWTDDKVINTENIYLNNCQALECRRNGFAVGAGDNVTLENCYAYKTNGTAPEAGLDIEPESRDGHPFPAYINNMKVINFISKENDEIGINVFGKHKQVKNLIIDNHFSINEKQGARFYLNTDTELNESNVIYKNSTIKNASGTALYVQRVTDPAYLTLQNIIFDGKANANGGSCVELYGVSNGNSLENIIIDNINYIKSTEFDFTYLINQQHSFEGNVLNIRLKNISRLPNAPKIAFYDGKAGVYFENCNIENDSAFMGGVLLNRYDLFTKYINSNLTSHTLMSIYTTIPDNIYETIFINNHSYRSGLSFSNDYTVYKDGVVVNNIIDCVRPTSFCKFQKIGNKIIILNTDFNTAEPTSI